MTRGMRVDVVGIGEAMVLLVPESEALGVSRSLRMRMAGAESNVLIGLARLGHACAYLSAVGDDPLGGFVVDTLADEGIDTTSIRRDVRRRTGVFFKDPTPEADRRVYYYREGSAASVLGVEALGELEARSPKILVVSGLTLGLGGTDGLGALAATAIHRADMLGTTVVFDANLRAGVWDGGHAAAEFEQIRGNVDILLAGCDELRALVPGTGVDAAARLLCHEGCRAVVLKDGPRGATVVEEHGSTHVPAPVVEEVVDAVGAGDAFTAGVVSGVLRGWSVPEGARLGAALAGRVITAHGDWEVLPSGSDAARLVAEVTSVGTGGSR